MPERRETDRVCGRLIAGILGAGEQAVLIIEAYRKNYVTTLQPLRPARQQKERVRERGQGDACCLMDGRVSRLCSHKPPLHPDRRPHFYMLKLNRISLCLRLTLHRTSWLRKIYILDERFVCMSDIYFARQ